MNQIRLILFLILITRIAVAESVKSLLGSADAAYAKQNYTLAIDLYSQAIDLDTNNSSAYMGRGGAYGRVGKFDKAEADLNRAITLATNNVRLSVAFSNRGFLFAQTKNFESAINDFSKAVELNPSYQAAYMSRAFVYNMQRAYDLAIPDCNMAIMLNPDQPTAYRCKGDAYYGKQEYGTAIEVYTKAIEIETNASELYFSRGVAFFSEENYKQAIKDFDNVIQIQPTNAWAFASRGLAKSRVGDFKGGIDDCQKGVMLDTNCYNAYNNLAWLQATAPKSKFRDGKAAVENARRACELTAWKDAYCLGTFAVANAENEDFTEAVKWERKCIVIGLPEKEMAQARKELNLFEEKKPYHADK